VSWLNGSDSRWFASFAMKLSEKKAAQRLGGLQVSGKTPPSAREPPVSVTIGNAGYVRRSAAQDAADAKTAVRRKLGRIAARPGA
jgi:hypothetical protein